MSDTNHNNLDYRDALKKARKKRKQNPYQQYVMIGGGVLVIILLIIAVVLAGRRSAASGDAAGESGAPAEETTLSAEEQEEKERLQAVDEVVSAYGNLGVVQVSGYLNVRETPSSDGTIIGNIMGGGGCDILDTSEDGGWYHISSGGFEGYVSSQYVLTGEDARAAAADNIKKMAVITTDSLRVRSEPVFEGSDNVVGAVARDERYEVLSEGDGWVQIEQGYISTADGNAEVRYCLNEARKLDMRTMAVNQYSNLLVSKVNNYLNVRSSPTQSEGMGNVIGKLPSRAAAEILETSEDGQWYKIKSGAITGYVSADPQYIATGQEARDLALQEASLMAVVKVDGLRVRTEPSTDSKIWTQLTMEEKYPVLNQLDGWVQIELDTGEDTDNAYISTRDNNVEVRYALPEAIKFSPLEEKANAQMSRRSQIVNYALQFVGNPYVWGGTSLTKGADCSGFTMKVLEHFGISLPHYSGSQAKMGRSVSSSEMRPGDLIFYANSSGTVNHVAMYIGNGQIVHAASRRSGIKISTWNYRQPKTIRNVID
ncbi:MAG TPA: SH3 domain-containing protein [Candidatus Lachnoclostridium pullistercoris]|uniref:SH3 domain-containing protein n=1 Tax=Candidatus Lachnoclostridium pullistercoris TaxID=2838632 RepID=A0A9D2T7Q5_9FIRM|nr:SH3 domain-containing protein [Candidatus Lachnoclostridium pullistercoris]